MLIQSASRFRPEIFNPNSYWDAANPNGDGTRPANTDPVSSIIDLGAQGNDLAQSDPGLQPVYIVDVINGQPGFMFSGAQQLTRASSASNEYIGASTIIAVASTVTTATSARILNKGAFGGGTGGGWGAGRSTSAYMYTSYTVKDYTSATGQWVVETPQIATYRLNNDGSFNFFKNGVAAGSSAAASFPPASSQPLLFGGGLIDGVSNQFWSGAILLVLWFWSALPDAELSPLHNYCKQRFGIS